MMVNRLQVEGEENIFDFPLGIPGFSYSDLYRPERLKELAESFYGYLAQKDPPLAGEFERYRQGESISTVAESNLLVQVAAHQSEFIARLFQIEEAREESISEHNHLNPVYRFKKEVVIRRALKKYGVKTGEHLSRGEGSPSPGTAPIPDSDPLASLAFTVQGIVAAVNGMVPEEGERSQKRDPELEMATAACFLLDLEEACQKALDPKEPHPVPREAQEQILALRKELGDSPETDSAKNLLYARDLLDLIERWVALACLKRKEAKDGEGKNAPVSRSEYDSWVSLKVPEDIDWPDGLVEFVRPREELPEAMETPPGKVRYRDGFKCTDPRWGLRETLDAAHYCIICHEREKDSCSRGLPLPRKDRPIQKNPLGVPLTGCPLEERISEMHLLKRQGDTIAALAMVMIDNPMCPITGHRICNDCMKSCIYQKQDPVNIPQIETRSLTDVLNLPYGVEIYGLLTRWNPVNVRRPYMLPYNGKNVLVVGMGPAGFSLSQYLLNEGFGVVGIDGLKVDPLPPDLVGAWNGAATEGGEKGMAHRPVPKPVKWFAEINDDLDQRISAGFGGVAEYGITVRWDKNFLKLIYVTLMRRETFRVYGGVRFGGTLTAEDAWDLGFHHLAIAAGAGTPTVVEMKNNLIPGIRMASDFLMGLQLTGAYKKFSIVNLQLRMPVLVIGGGLTGIDTATETMAYYPLQVEKILERYEVLVKECGEEAVWKMYNEDEKEILREFLAHGQEVRLEREKARSEGRSPAFASLCRKWGGVSLVYRKNMQDSPAYRLNHEEIIKALEEGITYVECLDPREAIPDKSGWVSAVTFEKMREAEPGKWEKTGELVTLPARSVLMAAGTSPNVIYERESPGRIQLDARNRFYQGYRMERSQADASEGGGGRARSMVPVPQTREDHGFLTSYEKDGHYISYYGDNHPVYAGSVVKAVASAKYGSLAVTELFAEELAKLDSKDQPARDLAWEKLVTHLDHQLKASVEKVIRLTPTITEAIIRAPLHARKFQPGQFYRLQTYETTSLVLDGTKLQMEGVALTGAWVDKEKGLLSLISLELGVSSRLVAFLRLGEEVICMGPTGYPSEIGKDENVVLCGGGLGNAVLFSIARGMKEAGNRVVYFAGYKKPEDLFHRDDIELACGQVIWSVDAGEPIKPRRPQDRSFVGNIVQAMLAYGRGELGETLFPLESCHRILAIGSDRMMAAVRQARYGVLAPYFNHPHVAIASINSPMQCMMKGVCAQCLQRHIDPETGKEQYVFSCAGQDQKMDSVDWKHLNERLRQNTVQEKLSNLWMDYLIRKNAVEHV